jgi:two-component system chemotaxis response regulator CheB
MATFSTISRQSSDLRPTKAIVIGSSTGGPNALTAIFEKLKETSVPTIFIAQHMLANFLPDFVKLLKSKFDMNIQLGSENLVVEEGVIYIAPGDGDMEVVEDETGMLRLHLLKSSNSLTPSIDVLMKSVAKIFGEKTLGIILTGMGDDGLEGMRALKQFGGHTIAQDQITAEIPSMPRAIIAGHLADQSLTLKEIPDAIRLWSMANE